MSGSAKLGLYILLTVAGIWLGIRILGALISTLMPILVVAGIALVIYGVVSGRRALGVGRRTLP